MSPRAGYHTQHWHVREYTGTRDLSSISFNFRCMDRLLIRLGSGKYSLALELVFCVLVAATVGLVAGAGDRRLIIGPYHK